MPRTERLADMYEVLGVLHDADGLSIRRRYREKARALRLDVSQEPDAGERFRELTHAYEVLSKPSSRLLYERLALHGPSRGKLEPVPLEGKPTGAWPHLGDEELIVWVLGSDRRQKSQRVRATKRPSGDLVLRWLAAAGFVIALVLLVVVLLRG